MTSKLNDFLKTFTPAEQVEIQARASVLIEEELTLRALRQAHDLTQERMAELLGVKQENISRMGTPRRSAAVHHVELYRSNGRQAKAGGRIFRAEAGGDQELADIALGEMRAK